MPYKVPQSKVEQQLTREVAHKLVELAQVQHEQDRLIYQADVLHHLVHLMGCLCQADGVKAEPLDGRDSYGDEELLLEQLGKLTCVASAHNTTTAAASNSAAAAVKPEADNAPPLGHVQPLRSSSSLCSTCSSGGGGGSEDKQATAAAAGTSRSSGGGDQAGLPDALMGDAASVNTFSQQQQQQQPLLHQTIAPDGDHLAVFRHLISLPPYEGAESITLQQMQQEYSSLVCELMLHVALLEEPQLQGGGCACGEQSLRAVAALVTQHLHLLTTLLLQQRGDLLQAFYLSDCLSGEVGDQQQLQVVSAAVSQVELSDQQRQELADIMVVFQRLLAPLIATRQQLQTNASSASSAAAGAGSSSSSSSEGVSFGGQEDEASLESPALAGRGSLLQQQARVACLSMVMRKELFLKACCFATAIGRLEWLQVARLIIAIFPFPMAMSVVGQEISRQFGEQQQQQQSLRQQQLRRAQEAVRALHKGRRRGKKRAQ